MKDLTKLPDDLPAPVDDGACAHLPGARIPSMPLAAVSGGTVDLGALPGTVVVYFYPMTGRPDSAPLIGWNEIPGARGCTPQSCAFRDRHAELESLAADVFGVSAQPLEEQKEARARLGLPFELLNDSGFALAEAMHLPTFEYKGTRLIKRLTVISVDGIIRKVFYPVFPPNRNAEDVIAWLRKAGLRGQHPSAGKR
jgi:peroxiredoxin